MKKIIRIIFWLAFRKMKTYYNMESQKAMTDYKYAWQRGWNDCIRTIKNELNSK